MSTAGRGRGTYEAATRPMLLKPTRLGFSLPRLFAIAALAAVLFVPENAHADTYRVVGVGPGDALNIRIGPSARFPVIGRLARNARGVQGLGDCVRRWCPVRDGLTLGWASARFLERESRGPAPGSGGAAGTAPPGIDSVVLPDGTMEVRFPDGRISRRKPDGKFETQFPDGSISMQSFVQVPGADLPPLPGELGNWGTQVADGLLGVLNNILTNAEFEAYQQTEAGKDFYEVLDWRIASIRFLTTPAQ